MLTPPRDSSPELSRPTGFHIEVNPRNEVGSSCTPWLGLRWATCASSLMPPVRSLSPPRFLNIPNKVSLQTWSERQAEDLELVLTAQHVASSDMQPDSTYRIIVLRRVTSMFSATALVPSQSFQKSLIKVATLIK